MNSAKYFIAALSITACIAASSSLQIFGHTWTVPDAGDWQVQKEGETEILRLVTSRGPLPGPRRPIQFALCEMSPAGQATIEVDIRPTKRSVIIVYNYQDQAHFDYAHLSTDTGAVQPVHNGIFHVFGGERVRISSQAGPAAFSATNRWYHVKLVFNDSSGSVDVAVDDQPIPALHAVDVSLSQGKIGLGSFDETGDFKNFKLSTVSPSQTPPLHF